MRAPLVELAGVDVQLGGRAALVGVSLTLREGESWALLGPNGSGKSTLLRVLRGEIWPQHQGGGRRVFHLGGLPEESPIGASQRVGIVSAELQQEYTRRDWAIPVEAVARSGFTDSVWPPEPAIPAQAERIAEVLAELGIAHLSGRAIVEISSGEARKVLLARAIVSRPRLLFLDEPCHGLDAASRAGFLSLVSRIARAGTPIVLATHRQQQLVPEITKVAVLHGGRILAQGDREDVLHRRRARATVTPTVAPSAHSLASRHPRRDRSERSAGARAGFAVIEVGGSAPRPPGLAPSTHPGVVGPNGAGKSTLLRLVVGDEQAMPGGRVSRLQLGERASVWDVKARVGIASPELQARHRTDARAEDVVASGFTSSIGLCEAPSAEERATASRCMARVGVAHLAGRGVHALSYGEMRKLLVARALVRDPELLVLDEPCDGLDPESRAALLAAIQSLCEGGTQVVLVTHHEEDLLPAIGYVLELARGRAVYQGPRSGWRARART